MAQYSQSLITSRFCSHARKGNLGWKRSLGGKEPRECCLQYSSMRVKFEWEVLFRGLLVIQLPGLLWIRFVEIKRSWPTLGCSLLSDNIIKITARGANRSSPNSIETSPAFPLSPLVSGGAVSVFRVWIRGIDRGVVLLLMPNNEESFVVFASGHDGDEEVVKKRKLGIDPTDVNDNGTSLLKS